jgi:hypothetical protein
MEFDKFVIDNLGFDKFKFDKLGLHDYISTHALLFFINLCDKVKPQNIDVETNLYCFSNLWNIASLHTDLKRSSSYHSSNTKKLKISEQQFKPHIHI